MKLTYTEATMDHYNDNVWNLAMKLADKVDPDSDVIDFEVWIEEAIENLLQQGKERATHAEILPIAEKLWREAR